MKRAKQHHQITAKEHRMKISLSKFYKEVTGATTVNRGTTTAALHRWGVPFDITTAKADVVDIVHLEPAKKVYAAEMAAKTATKAAQASSKKVAPSSAQMNAVQRFDNIDKTLAEVNNKLAQVSVALSALLKLWEPATKEAKTAREAAQAGLR